MKFSIIIINFRQKDFTKKCVESVFGKLSSGIFELTVVNNSPEDDLSEIIRIYPGVRLIINENKGFSQANNLAASGAVGEYLVFLNADTLILEDFTNGFLEFAGKYSFGAAGLNLVNPDGSFQLSYWKENTFFKEILNKSAENSFWDKDRSDTPGQKQKAAGIRKVDWVTGAAMIIMRETFNAIGGFDESFFLFYEDADICKRLNEEGLANYYVPAGKILHHKGENVNENFKSNTYYYAKESQLKYYGKHNGFLQRFLLRAYLVARFSLKYFSDRSAINRRIIKLAVTGKSDDKNSRTN